MTVNQGDGDEDLGEAPMMANLLREAGIDDLDSVIALTKANRARRARLHADYWPPARCADEVHGKYLESLLRDPKRRKLALEKDGRVIGFAAVQPRLSFSFIDDICLADDADWETDGVELLVGIQERPALATIAHSNQALLDAARRMGLTLVSTHRLFELNRFDDLAGESSKTMPTDLAEAPSHVFAHLMEQQLKFVLVDGDGYAVCSESIAPPPILDIGGTCAVIDRVVGHNRRALLEGALGFLQKRGDVKAIVIVAAEDHELSGIADSLGASHPVDVLKWPDHQTNDR